VKVLVIASNSEFWVLSSSDRKNVNFLLDKDNDYVFSMILKIRNRFLSSKCVRLFHCFLNIIFV
jgi:hypothetical protein